MADFFSRLSGMDSLNNTVSGVESQIKKLKDLQGTLGNSDTKITSAIQDMIAAYQQVIDELKQNIEKMNSGLTVDLNEVQKQIKSIDLATPFAAMETAMGGASSVAEQLKRNIKVLAESFREGIDVAGQLQNKIAEIQKYSIKDVFSGTTDELKKIGSEINNLPSAIDKLYGGVGSSKANQVLDQISELERLANSSTAVNGAGTSQHAYLILNAMNSLESVHELIDTTSKTIQQIANGSKQDFNMTDLMHSYERNIKQLELFSKTMNKVEEQLQIFGSTGNQGAFQALSELYGNLMDNLTKEVLSVRQKRLDVINSIDSADIDRNRLGQVFIDSQLTNVKSGNYQSQNLRTQTQALVEVAGIERGSYGGVNLQGLANNAEKLHGLSDKIDILKGLDVDRKEEYKQYMGQYENMYDKRVDAAKLNPNSKSADIDAINKEREDNRSSYAENFSSSKDTQISSLTVSLGQQLSKALKELGMSAGDLKKLSKSDLDNMSTPQKERIGSAISIVQQLEKLMQGNANYILAAINQLRKSGNIDKDTADEIVKELTSSTKEASIQTSEMAKNIKETNMNLKEFINNLSGLYRDLQGSSRDFFSFFGTQNLLDPIMWKNEVFKQRTEGGRLESQMALGEMAYGQVGHNADLYNQLYNMGYESHKATGGMIDQYAFAKSFIEYNKNVQGQYGGPSDPNAMKDLATTSTLLSTSYGVSDGAVMGMASTFYKELKMSAEDTNLELLKMSDISKDLNIPFDKLTSTIGSLSISLRNMGIDGQNATNAIGNLTSQGVSLDIAQSYTGSVSKALTGMSPGMLAFAGSQFLGQQDFTKTIADYQYGLFKKDGQVDESKLAGLDKMATGMVNMYAGIGSTKSEKDMIMGQVLEQQFGMDRRSASMAMARLKDGDSLASIFKDFNEKGTLDPNDKTTKIIESQDKLRLAIEAASKSLSGLTQTQKAIEGTAGNFANTNKKEIDNMTNFSKGIYGFGESINNFASKLEGFSNALLIAVGGLAAIKGLSAIGNFAGFGFGGFGEKDPGRAAEKQRKWARTMRGKGGMIGGGIAAAAILGTTLWYGLGDGDDVASSAVSNLTNGAVPGAAGLAGTATAVGGANAIPSYMSSSSNSLASNYNSTASSTAQQSTGQNYVGNQTGYYYNYRKLSIDPEQEKENFRKLSELQQLAGNVQGFSPYEDPSLLGTMGGLAVAAGLYGANNMAMNAAANRSRSNIASRTASNYRYLRDLEIGGHRLESGAVRDASRNYANRARRNSFTYRATASSQELSRLGYGRVASTGFRALGGLARFGPAAAVTSLAFGAMDIRDANKADQLMGLEGTGKINLMDKGSEALGSAIGGVAGTALGAALAPFTFGLSAIATPLLGMAGAWAGGKIANMIGPSDKEVLEQKLNKKENEDIKEYVKSIEDYVSEVSGGTQKISKEVAVTAAGGIKEAIEKGLLSVNSTIEEKVNYGLKYVYQLQSNGGNQNNALNSAAGSSSVSQTSAAQKKQISSDFATMFDEFVANPVSPVSLMNYFYDNTKDVDGDKTNGVKTELQNQISYLERRILGLGDKEGVVEQMASAAGIDVSYLMAYLNSREFMKAGAAIDYDSTSRNENMSSVKKEALDFVTMYGGNAASSDFEKAYNSNEEFILKAMKDGTLSSEQAGYWIYQYANLQKKNPKLTASQLVNQASQKTSEYVSDDEAISDALWINSGLGAFLQTPGSFDEAKKDYRKANNKEKSDVKDTLKGLKKIYGEDTIKNTLKSNYTPDQIENMGGEDKILETFLFSEMEKKTMFDAIQRFTDAIGKAPKVNKDKLINLWRNNPNKVFKSPESTEKEEVEEKEEGSEEKSPEKSNEELSNEKSKMQRIINAGIGARDVYSGIGSSSSLSKMTSISNLYAGAGISSLASGQQFNIYDQVRGAISDKKFREGVNEENKTYKMVIDVKGISNDPSLVAQITKLITAAVAEKMGNKVVTAIKSK